MADIGASVLARLKIKAAYFGGGDIIVPHQEKRKLPKQLPDFEAPEINTYSVETTVAEKLDAILSLMEFSSRMKDYYDLYYLANKFDFDGSVLTEALQKTFANRNRQFTIEQFEHIMTFGADDGMQKKWKAFTKKIDTKTDAFETVLGIIKNFLAEPFRAVVEGAEYSMRWISAQGIWNL